MSDPIVPEHEYRYRPTWTLGVFSIAGLSAMLLLSLGTCAGDAIRLYGTGIATDGVRDADLIGVGVLIRGLLSLVTLAVYVPLVVLFCIWTYRSAANARALGAGGFEVSPGWAVGWYFIPFANLWMPFKAMSEIWRASRSELPEQVPGQWRDSGSGFILGSWWLAWILGRSLDAVARPLARGEAFGEALGSILHVAGSLLESIAALLCIAVVYRLTVRQHDLACEQLAHH